MADPNVPYYLQRPDSGLTPQQIADLQEIQKLIPPYYEQVGEGIFYDPRFGTFYSVEKNANPGQPTQRYNPDTGEIETVPGSKGNFILQKATDSQAKYLRGNLGYPTGGSTQRLASDDPRYWQFQYDQLNEQAKEHVDTLAYQYYNAGLDADSARRQALMSFISARDSLSANTAQTSADVAKQAADYAAHPADPYAEAYYANQVGGSTPFGDLNNSAFGEYGKTLAEKGARIFQNVAGDLDKSRAYRDAIPPLDFLSAGQQAQLGGGGSAAPAANSAPAAGQPSPQDLISAYNAYHPTAQMPGAFYGFNSPEEAQAMAKYFAAKGGGGVPATPPPPQITKGGGGFSPPPSWSTGGLPSPSAGPTAPPSFIQQPTESGLIAPTVGKVPTSVGGTLPGGRPTGPVLYGKGGTIDFGNLTRFGADQPTSSEGGTNMNIHEPAVLIGLHSGRHYATVAENGYPEQIKITPTPSGKKAAMEAAKAGKAQKDVMGKAFGAGGTVAATPDQLYEEFSKQLQRLGGSGGGSQTPFGGARFLAGAPANAIMNDPRLRYETESTYDAMGIRPNQLWADVQKFTPEGITNNSPRVNFA